MQVTCEDIRCGVDVMQRYDIASFVEMNQYGMSSPTCQDLGIPNDDDAFAPDSVIRNPALYLDGLRYEANMKGFKVDPFGDRCLIPMPTVNGFGQIEPSFVRKRNERERERVRCVNEGYAKLKRHLPVDTKDKRISKVETLRAAIEYIRYLQTLLNRDDSSDKRKNKRTYSDGLKSDDEYREQAKSKRKYENSCTSDECEDMN